VVVVRGLVFTEPLVGWVPLHPSDAVQVCASVAFHSSVTERPTATVLALGARVTTGAALTVAVVELELDELVLLSGLTCAC
jgi:hypothetical protein